MAHVDDSDAAHDGFKALMASLPPPPLHAALVLSSPGGSRFYGYCKCKNRGSPNPARDLAEQWVERHMERYAPADAEASEERDDDAGTAVS